MSAHTYQRLLHVSYALLLFVQRNLLHLKFCMSTISAYSYVLLLSFKDWSHARECSLQVSDEHFPRSKNAHLQVLFICSQLCIKYPVHPGTFSVFPKVLHRPRAAHLGFGKLKDHCAVLPFLLLLAPHFVLALDSVECFCLLFTRTWFPRSV